MKSKERYFWYIIVIVLLVGIIFTVSYYLGYKSATTKYKPTSLVVVEYIKIDTVYIKTSFYDKKPPVYYDGLVATLTDTLVTEEKDSIGLMVSYYHPPINQFEYWIELRKARITEKRVDSIYIEVPTPPIVKEIYKNDYKLISGVGIVGMVIGLIFGFLID